MLLHMDSIASATQLANHDQDRTKALLMWHKTHYGCVEYPYIQPGYKIHIQEAHITNY